MSLMVWDTDADEPLIEQYDHHDEFVVGLDWNLEEPGQLASCSWDETVYVWHRGDEPVATHGTHAEEDGEDMFSSNQSSNDPSAPRSHPAPR